MKTTNEIITILRDFKVRCASKYGISRLALFGSTARGEQNEYSDIDVAYEGEPNIILRSGIKHELETLLECKVDVIRIRKKIEDASFEENIAKDLIYV